MRIAIALQLGNGLTGVYTDDNGSIVEFGTWLNNRNDIVFETCYYVEHKGKVDRWNIEKLIRLWLIENPNKYIHNSNVQTFGTTRFVRNVDVK